LCTKSGTYTLDQHCQWVEKRKELDRRRYQEFYANTAPIFSANRSSGHCGSVPVAAGSIAELREQLHWNLDPLRVQTYLQRLLSQHRAGASVSNQTFLLPTAVASVGGRNNNIPDIVAPINQHMPVGISIMPDPTPHATMLAGLVSKASTLARTKRDGDQVDAYGSEIADHSISIQETEIICHTARMAVWEALNGIRDVDKYAYSGALRRAPQLVEKESPVMDFVRRDNYNATAALLRLLRYWKIRVELFGVERAFLPMTQQQGAISQNDLIILYSGVYAILPKDRAGRSVVVEDRNLMLDDSSDAQQSKLRCLFYIISCLCGEFTNSTDEFVLLSAVISPRVTAISADATSKALEVIDCFPIRLKAAHLLVCPPKSNKRKIIKEIMSVVEHIFVAKFGTRTILSSGKDPADLAAKLKEFGLEESSLPPSFGGHWPYENWMRFLKNQHQREVEQDLCCDVDGEGEPHPKKASAIPVSKPLSETEKQDRKRKMNAIHSRLKRERKRVETDRLQGECNDLAEANRRCEADNVRLEKLLTEARCAVAQYEEELHR